MNINWYVIISTACTRKWNYLVAGHGHIIYTYTIDYGEILNMTGINSCHMYITSQISVNAYRFFCRIYITHDLFFPPDISVSVPSCCFLCCLEKPALHVNIVLFLVVFLTLLSLFVSSNLQSSLRRIVEEPNLLFFFYRYFINLHRQMALGAIRLYLQNGFYITRA